MISALFNTFMESNDPKSAAYVALDVLLGSWTLFHILVALGYMAVPDASYKKALLKFHRNFHKPVSDSPFVIPFFNTLSTLLVFFCAYEAYHYHDEGDFKIVVRSVVALHNWATAFFLQKMSSTLIKLGVDYCMKIEKDIEIHDIKTWTTPPKWTGSVVTAPLTWFMRPEFHGADNLPPTKDDSATPGLYVMNHALYGLEMTPFVATLYKLKDIYVRGLADHFHFGQLHGEFIRYFGAVDGTRDNVDALMETNQNVLVYPGGGEEIMKPCAVPKYTLMWKERLGFARCAIKHGYPIVPCCSVGTEDMWTRLFDVDVGFIKKGMKAPIGVILPHNLLQKVYYWVGEPIPTAQYKGDYKNDEFAREVRDKVKAAVEAGIQEMKDRQAADPDRDLIKAVGNSFLRLVRGGGSDSEASTKAALPKSESSEPLPMGSEISEGEEEEDSTSDVVESKKTL